MESDRNLLFGVLALQLELLDSRQFSDACCLWAARKDESLADLLVARGWLTASDRAEVERLLERKLRRHGGDAREAISTHPRFQKLLQSLRIPPKAERSQPDGMK